MSLISKAQFIVLFLLIIQLFSCERIAKKIKKNKEENSITDSSKNLLTSTFFQPNTFYKLSTPYWFNSKIIAQKNIASIEVKILPYLNDSIDSLFPDFTHKFFFNKSGEITHLENTTYYQGLSLSTEGFKYKGKQDKYGLKQPLINTKIKNNNKTTTFIDEISVLAKYELLELEKEEEHYVIYLNKINPSEPKKVYITDSTYWKVMEVDKLQKKYGIVRICYGTPTLPYSCFDMSNLVNRSNIIECAYFSSLLPKSISTNKGLIRNELRFKYDSIGRIDAYSETNLSPDNSQLNQYIWKVMYEDEILPSRIVQRENYKDSLKLCKELQFEYFFND